VRLTCAAATPAPHIREARFAQSGRRRELEPCRRPTAAFSTTSRVS
jgi:hypothetical protein